MAKDFEEFMARYKPGWYRSQARVGCLVGARFTVQLFSTGNACFLQAWAVEGVRNQRVKESWGHAVVQRSLQQLEYRKRRLADAKFTLTENSLAATMCK
jgi:hypothetical protein